MQNSGRYAEKAGGRVTYGGNRNLTISTSRAAPSQLIIVIILNLSPFLIIFHKIMNTC